jgi:hypothetical protein
MHEWPGNRHWEVVEVGAVEVEKAMAGEVADLGTTLSHIIVKDGFERVITTIRVL